MPKNFSFSRAAAPAAFCIAAFLLSFRVFAALRILPGWCGPVAACILVPATVLSAVWLCVFCAMRGLAILKKRDTFASFAVYRLLTALAAICAACAAAALLASPRHFAGIWAFMSGHSDPGPIPEGYKTGVGFAWRLFTAAVGGSCASCADAPSYVSLRWDAFALDLKASYPRYRELVALSALVMAGLPAALSAVLAAAAAPARKSGALRRIFFASAYAAATVAGAAAAFALARPAGNPRYFETASMRDTTYGGSPCISAVEKAGHSIAVCKDVPDDPAGGDFKGEIVTVDGRALIPGHRFVRTRILNALIPLAETAGADGIMWAASAVADPEAPPPETLVADTRIVACGIDCTAFLESWKLAGAIVAEDPGMTLEDDGKLADIMFVAPEPDWALGAKRPDASFWKTAKKRLHERGICVYRIDTRLMTPGRAKTLVEDFSETFPHFRAWCTGPHDILLVARGDRPPPPLYCANIIALCSIPGISGLAVRATGPETIPGLASSWIGGEGEIAAALSSAKRESAFAASRHAPRLAYGDDDPDLRALRCGDFTPEKPRFPEWLAFSRSDRALPENVVKEISKFQSARVDAVRGLVKLDAGDADAAYAAFAKAAEANPDDAVLRSQRDLLAIQCLQMLRKNDPKSRMEAYRYLENIATIFPKDPSWQFNLGQYVLEFSGRSDIASQLFSRAAAFSDPKLNPEYLETYARTVMNAGQWELAQKAYTDLSAAFPSDPGYMLSLAKAYAAAKNPSRDEERAVALARKAMAAAPGDQDVARRAADILIDDCNRLREGLEIKRAIRGGKPHP